MAGGNKKEYSLGFVIGAQLKSSFGSSFKKIGKQLDDVERAAKKCGNAWKKFGKDVGALALGIVGSAATVTAAVWKMTDSVGDQAVAIGRNAATLKMSTEDYQKLAYAFDKAGIGGDEFVGIMTQLDAALLKASKNSKSAKAFEEATGLSAEKLARMDPSTRVERMADYLNSIQDPLEKDEIAMELFGKGSLEMERILSMGSQGIQEAGKEFVDIGALIEDETISQAEDYTAMRKKLQTQTEGIKTQLLENLLPSFTTLFETVSSLLKDVDWKTLGENIGTWVSNLVEKLPEIVEQVGQFIDKVSNGVQSVADFVGGWDKLGQIILDIYAMKTAFSGIKAVVSTIGLVASMGPWGWAIMGIVLIIALVIRYWDKIKETVERVVAAVIAKWNSAKLKISAVATSIKAKWNTAVTAISTWVEEKVAAIQGFFSNIKTKINGYATSIKTWWVNVATSVTDWWDEKVGAILEFFSPIINFFSGIGETVGGFFASAWDTIKTKVEGFVNNILAVFQPVADFFSGIGAWITDLFGGKKTVQVDVEYQAMPGMSSSQEMGINLAQGYVPPGHAAGGIFNRPHLANFAENAPRVPEAAIPVENTPRSRSLWEQTGRMAGFTQGSGAGNTPAMGDINITIPISGNADANTVKQLKVAADDIAAQMRAVVRSEWAAMQREKARMAFT